MYREGAHRLPLCIYRNCPVSKQIEREGEKSMKQASELRVEHDSLGEIGVPAQALYGAQTQRAIDNFPISGLRPWPAFIWSLACIKRGAALVNHELKLLDKERSEAISEAAEEVMKGLWWDQFVVDPFQAGAGTSHHMNMNEVLANRATQLLGGDLGQYLVHPNDHVNMSQSTNDTIPTAIRLGCLWRLDELRTTIDDLVRALRGKGEQFDGIVKSGRTHLQDAVPVRLGQEFHAYARGVERDGERLQFAGDRLRRLGIGGTATGTGLNAHPEYHQRMIAVISDIAGFQVESSEDLFESMQSMADMASFSGEIRTLALTLTRIANDLRLLSSGPATGLDEIRLPAVQPGSSIMPGKVNPVMAEMLNMAMYHVIGADWTVALASQAGQLELNVMMPIIAHNLFEMMQITIGSMRAFTEKCVLGLSANREKAEAWLEKNAIVVTALNPLIGYEAGAGIVKAANNEGRLVKDVAMEMASRGELRARNEDRTIGPEEIEAALQNVGRLTHGGIIES